METDHRPIPHLLRPRTQVSSTLDDPPLVALVAGVHESIRLHV